MKSQDKLFSISMESALEKRPVQSALFAIEEEENDVTKWHRQFCLLTYKFEKYFGGLDEAEKLCKRAQEELETLKLKMREKYEIMEQDAARKLKLLSTIIEVKEKLRMELENAARSLEETMSDAAQNALKYETSAWVCRCIKTGCALVFNTVAAYALFRITQLFF